MASEGLAAHDVLEVGTHCSGKIDGLEVLVPDFVPIRDTVPIFF